MSNSEMKDKLASLGFIGDDISSTTNKKKPKIVLIVTILYSKKGCDSL